MWKTVRRAASATGHLLPPAVMAFGMYVFVAELLTRRKDTPLDSLTPRERETLKLRAEGTSATSS